MKLYLIYAIFATTAFLVLKPVPHCVPANSKSEIDRSPIDLAITSNGHFAITANATSNSVSLVDLENGSLIGEYPAGKRPFGVALSRDNRFCAVTNKDSDSITLFEVQPTLLKAIYSVPAGDEPRGILFSADGKRLFVALSGEDTVCVINASDGKLISKIDVGTEPWHLALSPDGSRLSVGNARSQDVSVINVVTMKIDHEVKLRGKNVRHIVSSSDGAWSYVLHDSERGRPTTKDNIDLGWVLGSRLSRVPVKQDGPRESIALDPRGKAVGDVDGLDISPDGKTIAFSAGGTHEVILLTTPLPFVSFGGPEDHVDPDVLKSPGKYRRVPLGGRPVGIHFIHGGKQLITTNYFGNSIQIIDVATAQLTKTIGLGGPSQSSVERQGEIIFHDATRSFNQWYSCNSCHTEGHTNGATFDTFNDGSYGTPKKTLSLRGVSKTGPWTWHGWQKDLKTLVHDSMTKSMQGPEPTQVDIDAVYAYLNTLDFRPNPKARSTEASVLKGKKLFEAKGCQSCHAPPYYTSPNAYKVGLEAPEDVFVGYNPPSLLGVYNRSPYLHTGDVFSLEQVLTEYHRPSKLTGKPDFTKQELGDIVAFLNTL